MNIKEFGNNVKEFGDHLVDSVKISAHKKVNDIKNAIENFKNAPGKEKALVILKTILVAAAVGLIGGLLLGPAVGVPAAIIAGTYAFYKFASHARSQMTIDAERVEAGINDVVKEGKRHVKVTIDKASEKLA